MVKVILFCVENPKLFICSFRKYLVIHKKQVEKVWLKNGDPGNNLSEMGLIGSISASRNCTFCI